ncbi:MAG: segregation/condensation protein A [Haloarculaceae archaeon]
MTSETPERSDGVSEQSSGERSVDDDTDDVPLNIAGHEERDPPDGAESLLNGDGSEAAAEGDERSADESTDAGANDSTDADADESDDAGADNDDGDEEVEPVEVLVGLADEGAIDPWDIDVVRVTDKFLERIDESDLRTSGRALFYASVLIRMKSDAMLADDDEEEPEEPEEPWMQGEEAPVDGPDPFASLEAEMDRRLERKRARGMPQTLDELVRDLREAERDSWWKESRSYDTSGSPSGFQRGTQELDYRAGDDLRMDDEPTAADVTGTAHAEDIDEIVEAVYGAVREHYDAGRDEVLYREISAAGGSRVETFLGLLFLSHRGRVRLRQDDLFGDLWIQDPNAVQGSDEALAD